PACGHTQHEIRELVLSRIQSPAVETEEDEHCHEPGTLVAVDKRVILHEIKQICGGLLLQARVDELTAEPRRRHGQRRLEKTDVADRCRTSVPRDLVRMEREHLVQREEFDVHYSA